MYEPDRKRLPRTRKRRLKKLARMTRRLHSKGPSGKTMRKGYHWKITDRRFGRSFSRIPAYR